MILQVLCPNTLINAGRSCGTSVLLECYHGLLCTASLQPDSASKVFFSDGLAKEKVWLGI